MDYENDAKAEALPLVTQAMGGGSEAGYALDRMAANRRYRKPTVREQVQERIAGLEKALAEHKATLAILDGEPGVEKALNALREIGV